MITDFKSLDHDDNLSKAIALIIAGSQNDFALLNEGRVIGVLTQKDLLSRLQTHGEKGVVADVMQRSFATVEATRCLKALCASFPIVSATPCRCSGTAGWSGC